MKKKFMVKEPVFKTETLFLCGYSHEEMWEELKKRGVEDFDINYFKYASGTSIFFNGVPSPFRLVWLRHFDKTPECIGTASHEIFHHVIRICDFKGIPITSKDNADETGAYLHDFYMRNFIGKLNV